MEYSINTVWDSDAAVWVASSDDVPGLCLESGSLDALIEKVKVAIPELLELNNHASQNQQISVNFNMQRKELVAV